MTITASMAWDMTGAAAAAAEGPQACWRTAAPRFFASRGMAAQPPGEKRAALPLRPRAAEAKPVSVIKPFTRGREGYGAGHAGCRRSEEHTSELQSLMSISFS